MSHSSERLELVTDFARLRAGMIVVFRPCRCRPSGHRFMLVRLKSGPIRQNKDEVDDGAYWTILPAPHADTPYVISQHSIDAKCIYRVVDGLKRAERQREAVR